MNCEDTIEQKDIIPMSLYFTSMCTGTKDKQATLYQYNGMTIEEIAMEAVLKVHRSKPLYLTGAYIKRTVLSVLRDLKDIKKLDTINMFHLNDDGEEVIINVPELTTEEDHNAIVHYLSQMVHLFDQKESEVLKLLIEEDLSKEEMADRLKVSRMTVFRLEQSIKDKIKEYYN